MEGSSTTADILRRTGYIVPVSSRGPDSTSVPLARELKLAIVWRARLTGYSARTCGHSPFTSRGLAVLYAVKAAM